jgi:hypothetical protein
MPLPLEGNFMTIRLLAVGVLCALGFLCASSGLVVAEDKPKPKREVIGFEKTFLDGMASKKANNTNNTLKKKNDPPKGTGAGTPDVIMSGARIKF